MECHNDAKESKLSKNDILNATYTLYFSHTDTAECKYHSYASPTIEKEFSFLLSNRSSEYPLSFLPSPELAKDRCHIKYSNWMIPGEIYHGKFHRRSYLDIHRLFCVVSRVKHAPV